VVCDSVVLLAVRTNLVATHSAADLIASDLIPVALFLFLFLLCNSRSKNLQRHFLALVLGFQINPDRNATRFMSRSDAAFNLVSVLSARPRAASGLDIDVAFV
jgi:hypothetical protein